MSYLLVFLSISLIITLHELGHLLAAKWMGIPISRFSVGFGPKLWGFKISGTEYCISLIPCGGYVMPGVDEDFFENLPLTKRIVFSLGGPVANILGAFAGLSLFNIIKVGFTLHSALALPLEQIGRMAAEMCAVIPSIFTNTAQLSGIVGIVATGGAHVGLSFIKLLQFSVLMNLNLALLNLLPILPLDGGKIIMGLLRKIHLPLRKLEIPMSIAGWVLLAGLMVYTTIMDITRVVSGV